MSATRILVVEDEKNEYGKFLKFETVTLFPIDKNLIEYNLLTKREVEWLNDYHSMVYEKISTHLKGKNKAWLKKKCAKI